MTKNGLISIYVLLFLVISGCKIDNSIITSSDPVSSPSNEAPQVTLKGSYSGFSEANSKGAPIFLFSGPSAISNLKLFTDSECSAEIPSDFSFDGADYQIRDKGTVSKYRIGEYSYYLQFEHNSTTYCQYLTKYTHDPVYVVSVIADETRRGIYLGIDNKGGTRVYNTSASAVAITDKMIYEIQKTVRNPKKFGYSGTSLYILTQNDDFYIYSSTLFPTTPDHTGVNDIYFTTPTANSVAFVKNDGTVASFGTVGNAPALSDVKELAVTRAGFVALTNDGDVTAWGTASLTNPINAANITDAVSMQPSNFGLYDLGIVVLRTNGNIQYSGHGLRPGSPSAPRLAAVNGKTNIQFYPGLNSLALTYTDAGVTKGYAWTGKGHGDSAAYDAQLVDLKKLVPNNDAYVAVLNNGDIYYWGLFGASNILPTAPEMAGVSDAVANDYTISETTNDIQGHAFALIRQDGTVTSFGHNLYGGNMAAVAADVNQAGIGVKKVVSTGRGFAALRNDGKVFVWGSCGMQSQVSLLSDIEDIVSSRSRVTTTCGFAAKTTDGRVFVVSNLSVRGDTDLTGVHVKKILSGNGHKLIYLNDQDDIIQVGASYSHLLNNAVRPFVDMGQEFYVNNGGSVYSVDGYSDSCLNTTLSLNPANVTNFSSYICYFNIYKTNGVWAYSNDFSVAAYNPYFDSFITVLNSQNIQKVWITAFYLIAMDVNGNIFHEQMDPTAPSISAIDFSVGVKDIYYSSFYMTIPSIVFHMKDNTVRYLGKAPLFQSFMGSIDALPNIQEIAVNVISTGSKTEVIVKDQAGALHVWSTEAAPTYAFLGDYVDALPLDQGRWVLKKNDGDFYYYRSTVDTLLLLGAGSVVTDEANNIKHKSKRVFVKLANYKLAMIAPYSAIQLTYHPDDDGFESVYTSDEHVYFAKYPNGYVKRLRIIESVNY